MPKQPPAIHIQHFSRVLRAFPRHLGPDFYDQIVSLCQQAGFSPDVTQEAIEMQTIVSLVAAGFGVALVPASLQNLRRVGVIYRRIQDATPTAELAMIWLKKASLPVLQTFMAVVKEVISRRRGWL